MNFLVSFRKRARLLRGVGAAIVVGDRERLSHGKGLQRLERETCAREADGAIKKGVKETIEGERGKVMQIGGCPAMKAVNVDRDRDEQQTDQRGWSGADHGIKRFPRSWGSFF